MNHETEHPVNTMKRARWLSPHQLGDSLRALRNVHPYFGMTFLAFKAEELPVGSRTELNFSALMRHFLERYYKPAATYAGYYSPFRTSNPANRWLTAKYPSGSLQRITVDTFGDAILHTKRRPLWGWREDYVDILLRLQAETDTSLVPAFHLAVWLYRDEPVLDIEELPNRLFSQFSILEEEMKLFDLHTAGGAFEHALVETEITERQLFQLIGWPPGSRQNESVAIKRLGFREVGPAKALTYEPSQRLNLLTGDNSLGKTFLLDGVWWAITRNWIEYPAAPRRNVERSLPEIQVTLDATIRSIRKRSSYNWDRQIWQSYDKHGPVGALAVYARHDGSFFVWDSVSSLSDQSGVATTDHVVLDRESLWHGKRMKDEHRGTTSICNGVLVDWVNWQTRGSHFSEIFGAFVRCLEILSPPGGQKLKVEDPISMPGNEQEIPALEMEYGTVPIVHASAGVKRVVALGYVLIWSWFRHQRNARLAGRDPFENMILVVDEIEAHLHPRWQRAIVPAVMEVVRVLSDDLFVQAHIATHSPLVLASAETVFEGSRDSLHHLDIVGETVTIDIIDFSNFGNVDAWLVSDVFGLKHARSIMAEEYIERAKNLQLMREPSVNEVVETNDGLRRYLRDDDEFWPRWRFFAQTIVSQDSE